MARPINSGGLTRQAGIAKMNRAGSGARGNASSPGARLRAKPSFPRRIAGSTGHGTARRSDGGLNLNPFDPNNSISRAGRNVARNIPAGAGSRAIGDLGRVPGEVGDSIRRLTPQGQLFQSIGNRINKVTGGR